MAKPPEAAIFEGLFPIAVVGTVLIAGYVGYSVGGAVQPMFSESFSSYMVVVNSIDWMLALATANVTLFALLDDHIEALDE